MGYLNPEERMGYATLPIGVGFSIRDGATAAAVASIADGVVVGSVLVDQIAAHAQQPEQARRAVSNVIREKAQIDWLSRQ
jgi:tryptophan synthase alpha chain